MLVSIQEEIDDAAVKKLIERVTTLVQDRSGTGVIIDLQQVEVMDSYLALQIESLAATLQIMQAQVVVVGLAVPVVITLLDFGIILPSVTFALDVEQAIVKLLEEG